MNFQFATAARIVFGAGRLDELADHLPQVFGGSVSEPRALVVTGSTPARAERLIDVLRAARIPQQLVHVTGEPTIDDAQDAVARGRDFDANLVIACGGGSAIDLAKAAALLIVNPGEPLDYLEVIGRGRKPTAPALPSVALPTTSGTGAEVTKNAVLASPKHRVKVSLRHESMLPRLALVDPELTVSVPREVTAATGLDALTQCIEPYLSCLHNPLTDGIARQGIAHGARSLERATNDGSDLEARAGMALCSLFGGLSLANAKLGAVHGFAGPFGGMFESPHGAVCARLLPLVLRANLSALKNRQPQSPLLPRFDELGPLLTGRHDARAEDAIEFTEHLVARLAIPPLSTYGMNDASTRALVEKAQKSSSMKGNPIALTSDELTAIVGDAL